jgi:hypothetical protein
VADSARSASSICSSHFLGFAADVAGIAGLFRSVGSFLKVPELFGWFDSQGVGHCLLSGSYYHYFWVLAL